MTIAAFFKTLVAHAPVCQDCGRKLYCSSCGSTAVTAHGWPGHNHRHVCRTCGMSEGWMV